MTDPRDDQHESLGHPQIPLDLRPDDSEGAEPEQNALSASSVHEPTERGNGEDGSQVPINTITTSNGPVVTCTYLNHPNWDSTANICLCFHYMMVKCAPLRVAQWAYQVRIAIIHFLTFMGLHNSKHPNSLHIRHIKDISPAVFLSFVAYLNKNQERVIHAAILKSALVQGAKETTLIPQIELPLVRVNRTSTTEPLFEDGVASLTQVTQKIVDNLRKKIQQRTLIDQAEPYTLEELQGHWKIKLSKNDVLVWYKHRISINMPVVRAQLMARLEKCNDPEIVELIEFVDQQEIVKSFIDRYQNLLGQIIVPEGYDPRPSAGTGWYNTTLSPHRVIKTLITHGYPFEFSGDSLAGPYSSANTLSYADCDDVIKMIIHKLSHVRNRYNLIWSEQKVFMLSMDQHMELYYPTATDVAGLVLFMMLQAGWNKEVVTDIDPDNYLHGLTSTIEENIKLIYAEKNRGQGKGLPYFNPKQTLSTSDSENPYSLYNLILLAKEAAAPIAKYSQHIIDPIRNRPVNTMFTFIRPLNAWPRAVGLAVSTADYGGQFADGVVELLAQNEVIDNGVRITSALDLTRRLRPTWLYYNAENTPYAFLSQLMGHSSQDTTDVSYDSSPVAKARRTKRLRSVLEKVVELLRARKFQGLLCKQASEVANADLSVIHLPYFDRALWACSDRYHPDWPGAEELEPGVKCVALEHCIFCSKLRILEDSLPFLIERISHIDELLRDRDFTEFGSQLESEREEIEFILDNWNDEEAIEDAIRYRALNSPLLPREMRELKLIFKTGDLDE